jgi:hypothetical protein
MRVALAPSAAARNNYALTSSLQITHQLTRCGVTDNGSDWDIDDAVVTAVPVTVAAHAMLPAAGFVELLVTQIEQCRELRIGNRDDITAVAAVAAARAAARNEFLTAKTDAAAPAVPGDDANLDFVNEFHAKNYSMADASLTSAVVLHHVTACVDFRLWLMFFSSAGQKKSPEEGLSSSNARCY